MLQDLDRVRANVAAAATEDLIERATVFRDQMEPAAVEIVEQELWKRGYGKDRIAEEWDRLEDVVIRLSDGTAAACSYCSRAALAEGWGWWHILWGRCPIFPRRVCLCLEHLQEAIK